MPQPEALASAPTQDAPLVERILHDLAANDAAIQNFRASGKFVLKSPKLQDVQVLRQSSIRFRRPAELHVIGRKYAKAVFQLTCSQDGFLIVLPTENSYFASDAGAARINSLSREVSPRDIANEMFFPEDWASLKPETVVLSDLAPEGGRAVLNVYESRRRTVLRRKVTVEGPPWRVVQNERYDEGGALLAVTTLANYHEGDGAVYATNIESNFPSENAYMQFDASTFQINVEQDSADFDLNAQLKDAEREGFHPIERN